MGTFPHNFPSRKYRLGRNLRTRTCLCRSRDRSALLNMRSRRGSFFEFALGSKNRDCDCELGRARTPARRRERKFWQVSKCPTQTGQLTLRPKSGKRACRKCAVCKYKRAKADEGPDQFGDPPPNHRTGLHRRRERKFPARRQGCESRPFSSKRRTQRRAGSAKAPIPAHKLRDYLRRSKPRDWVVADAVICEPVSTQFSLFSGKITGYFAIFRP
jgi:hypothetical protein